MFIRNLTVTQFEVPGKRYKDREYLGYHITGLITDSPSDGMWDGIDHPAVFRTKDQAEAFLAKIRLAKKDLKNWILPHHPCAAYQGNDDTDPRYYCPVKF